MPNDAMPASGNDDGELRIVIVSEHASARFGGEAILPLQYFQRLRARNLPVWLVVHERTRGELTELLPDAMDYIRFVPDLQFHRALYRLSVWMPRAIATASMVAAHFATQILQRRVVRHLVATGGRFVVHEPIPVSPRLPSLMYEVGAPVVIGPMNGGMDYPHSFQHLEHRLERFAMLFSRIVARGLNRLVPGKRRATTLLVANLRTRDVLPVLGHPHVVELVENAVDLSLFRPEPSPRRREAGRARFAFVGRLIRLKCVDILIHAVASARKRSDVELWVIGDGEEAARLKHIASELHLGDVVVFHGFVPQVRCPELLAQCDGLVLPSVRECGGTVVLEAMAMGLPVIATRWGGPADYLDESSGILVEPESSERFCSALAEAMLRISDDPALAARLGRAARLRVERDFDWAVKIDRILELYRDTLRLWALNAESRPSGRRPTPSASS